MDSDVALALMAKASAVFARDDQFLCFPLTPVVFSAAHLGFQDGTLPPAESLAAMAEFSRRMNIIPDDVLYPPTQETMLWQVLHDVFGAAQLAKSIRTTQEEQAYVAALAVLYVTGGDGLRTPTASYRAYKQWENAWTAAKQAYGQRAVEAQVSTDPTVQQRWQQDRPALQKAVDDAAARWLAEGYKDQIEAALGAVATLGARSPSAMWETWRSQFGEQVNALSAPDGDFFPTGFSPTDALRPDAWQDFTLARAEIAALVAQAPAELRARLDPARTVETDQVSFQYTSVSLTRPWAPPGMFSARFWKLPPTVPGLSDGHPTPQGQLPFYVAGVVFARNIRTVAARPVVSPPQPPPHPPVPVPPLRPLPWGPGQRRPGPLALHPAAVPATAGLAVAARAAAPAATAPLRLQMLAMPASHTAAAAKTAPQPLPAARARMVTLTAARLQAIGVQHITVPGTPPPAPPPQSEVPDVSVLAFLCQRLPKCPDPDPSLAW